jgi:hypothetical protein
MQPWSEEADPVTDQAVILPVLKGCFERDVNPPAAPSGVIAQGADLNRIVCWLLVECGFLDKAFVGAIPSQFGGRLRFLPSRGQKNRAIPASGTPARPL